MGRRSPTYSPLPRRGRGRSRSPSPSPRGRYPSRREPLREAPTSLLVRNLSKSCRAEDLRAPFKRFGPLRDIYLPRDYYSGEPRGFGFVQYLDPLDAEEAQYHMNHQVLYGRELTVVFAEESRKRPVEMRSKERHRGRGWSEDNGGFYSSHRGRLRTRSRSRTPPRQHRYTRSPSYEERRDVSSPESPARLSSEERHQQRRGRHESGRSGSESKKYREERSRSGSPVSADGRHAQKGSNKHESYSDEQGLEHDRSHSSRHVQPESPPRSCRKGRRTSPSHSGELSLERYSRSPSHSPPPRRGHSSRRSDSRSRSPPDNQYQHGSSDDKGASSEHSSLDE